MKIDKPVNSNYCASVVKIDKLVILENCANVQSAIIFGNSIIVGKDVKIGDVGLFFPLETKLSREYMCANNLHKHAELNADNTKKGYFDSNGRIRCQKFRGHKSEGFFMPLSSVAFAIRGDVNEELPLGTEFDKLGDIPICEKYIVQAHGMSQKNNADKKIVKRISRLVADQFRLMVDTAQLAKNLHMVNPDDFVSLTNKIHGTSWVVGKVLTKRKLKWYEKVCKLLGVSVNDTEYDVIYSSRRVVKNEYLEQSSDHYFGYNLWAEVAEEVKHALTNGITLYGEAVGWTKNGGAIQKGYHYNCAPNTHKLYLYRITQTSTDGKVVEYTHNQMKEFCHKFGLEMVPEFYYGRAKDMFGHPINDEWHNELLTQIKKNYVDDKMCLLNKNEVPAEGVVLRVEKLDDCLNFKAKSFKFYEYETALLDKGEADMETEEAEGIN